MIRKACFFFLFVTGITTVGALDGNYTLRETLSQEIELSSGKIKRVNQNDRDARIVLSITFTNEAVAAIEMHTFSYYMQPAEINTRYALYSVSRYGGNEAYEFTIHEFGTLHMLVTESETGALQYTYAVGFDVIQDRVVPVENASYVVICRGELLPSAN